MPACSNVFAGCRHGSTLVPAHRGRIRTGARGRGLGRDRRGGGRNSRRALNLPALGVVPDTNVLLSGIAYPGSVPGKLIAGDLFQASNSGVRLRAPTDALHSCEPLLGVHSSPQLTRSPLALLFASTHIPDLPESLTTAPSIWTVQKPVSLTAARRRPRYAATCHPGSWRRGR